MEVMIVVIIVAILAAIALPLYTRTVERSRMAEAYTQLSVIREAQLAYYNRYLQYADFLNDLINFRLDDPNSDDLYPNRYFQYKNIITAPISGDGFVVQCTRNDTNNVLGLNYYISMNQDGQIDTDFYSRP